MSLVERFRVGGLTCHLLDGGSQRLDGGAMFGVVPKPLWQRRIEPDERNRIPLALRCLLIESEDGPVLVDTGVGNKESDKFRDIYAVENTGHHGPTRLEDALHEAGFAPADVRWVINTHLHFDHGGGNTWVDRGDRGDRGHRGDSGELRLAFPKATYVVQHGELQFALNTNERTAASYLPPNFAPVSEADRWRLVRGAEEILPGIRVIPTPGHVPFHQSVLIESDGATACYLGDLIPTAAHVPLPWIMGYDLEPLVTLEQKRRLLGQAAAADWILVFEHDPVHGVGRAVPDGKSYAFESLDTG